MRFFLALFFLFYLSSVFCVQGELNPQYDIQLISPYKTVQKGKAFLVAIKISIYEDWYSYWSFPGDYGLPTTIKALDRDSFREIPFQNPIEIFGQKSPSEELLEANKVSLKLLPFPRPERKSLSLDKSIAYSFVYQEEVLIPVEVFIPEDYQGSHLNLNFMVEWGLCKEICLFLQDELNLSLPLGDSFVTDMEIQKKFDFWRDRFPIDSKKLNLKAEFWETGNRTQILSLLFDKEIQCLDAFPQSQFDFLNSVPRVISQSSQSCVLELGESESDRQKLSGLLIYSENGDKKSTLFTAQRKKKVDISLVWFIFMAFLGGLILNVMPCVLPILFLKIYNTLELKNLSRPKAVLLNTSYALGVIVSFLSLALFVFISKKTGESLGWGFHLQSPLFVSLLAMLFTMMAFYLLGALSFSIPLSFKLFKHEKLLSHFLTGVLSTTAASPCTVPFMAGAVGWAFSRSYLEIFSIFFFLGLGLSFPVLMLNFFPSAFKYLPPPGVWSQRLKKLFSIPLFLTSVWLLSILYLQIPLNTFLMILGILPVFILWIGVQKILSNSIKKLFANVVFVTSLVTFCAIVMIFRPSFKSPPIKATILNSSWQSFDENKIQHDRMQGKNVFVALGAKWCLTCQWNERIFKKKAFQDWVKQYKIQLYYGDWTNKTDSITSFLESHSRQGVPFYVFYKGKENRFIFSAFLTEESFLKKLEWDKLDKESRDAF